jgi:hypothetical protein
MCIQSQMEEHIEQAYKIQKKHSKIFGGLNEFLRIIYIFCDFC